MSDDPILAALTRLEAGQTALRADMDTMRDGQTRLRVDLMARMDRLENGLTAIRDDIVVNMARSNLAHDATVSAQLELQVMWRQIKRIESDVREIRGDHR